MLRLTALAFMPTVSVTFGALVLLVLVFPAATTEFARGAWLIYGAAALSIAISIPVAWFVARQMMSRRERRVLDGGGDSNVASIAGRE